MRKSWRRNGLGATEARSQLFTIVCFGLTHRDARVFMLTDDGAGNHWHHCEDRRQSEKQIPQRANDAWIRND